jgi:heme exporter protein C
MLVLFLTYLGYLALWASIEDEARAARLAAILCLAGLINIPIVRYSVEWWSTLHQGPSLLRKGGSAIDPSMLQPLLVMAGAYAAGAAAIVMALMRAEIYRRKAFGAAARRAQTA